VPAVPWKVVPSIDERAEQLRRQRSKAEPDGQTDSEQHQDIAGTSDSRAAVAHEQPYHTPRVGLKTRQGLRSWGTASRIICVSSAGLFF
jgi:hypothetical protein